MSAEAGSPPPAARNDSGPPLPRASRQGAATPLGRLLVGLLGNDVPVALRAYDGTALGPTDAPTTIVIRSPEGVRYVLFAPGELGLTRAYVAGDLEIEGDIYGALTLRHRLSAARVTPADGARVLRFVGVRGLRPPRRPPEEARLRGRRHSKGRDAAAIAHHYDVSNEFYRLVLGPSMTYSCAVWPSPNTTLEDAQATKYEVICAKLGLRPGMRLLDVGCGWGGMAIHAARHHGVEAVGVTLSREQATWASAAITNAGLGGRVEVRVQDYRDVDDGPYDAISSIGMFEHVGLARLGEYFDHLYGLLRPEGRLLNHGISRPPGQKASFARRSFIERYVFPDGELHEVGTVVSAIQRAGFEARHVESLREHYARTLRAWVANLEANWNAAAAAVGPARARIWRLYMAGSAVGFEEGGIQVHQVLAVRSEAGRSGMPPRPDWEPRAEPIAHAEGTT